MNEAINLLILALSGLVLLACELWGYRRWVQPHAAQINLHGKLMLLLVILTLMGGFIGPFGWWFDVPGSFAWDLPPLASRMLASAGWSFALTAFLALQRPSRRRMRLILLMLAVYLLPLLLALLLFHLDRMNFSEPITYPFLLVVLLLTAGALWFLIRQPAVLPDDPLDLEPSSGLARAWLWLVAVLSGLWGLALFVTDNGPIPGVWAWAGDLLTSRLIAVMLLTLAAAALFSQNYRDTARITLRAALLYSLGLAIASAWNRLAGLPVKTPYLLVFGLVFLGSLATWLLTTSQPRQAGAEATKGG